MTGDLPVVNIYCDESSHLEKDGHPYLVLGAVSCPLDQVRETSSRLRELKTGFGFSPNFEMKWSKVSHGRIEFYQSVLEEFASNDALRFRAIVAPKAGLKHEAFSQDHDTWYFKMYYQMLVWMLKAGSAYHIYVDIKDTRSAAKMRHLHDVLCSSKYDHDKQRIPRLQAVRSHEVEQVQLVDLLVGAVNYANRELSDNRGKVTLVEQLKKRGYLLRQSSPLSATKFNVFHWTPR
jgi:hypothetical protein